MSFLRLDKNLIEEAHLVKMTKVSPETDTRMEGRKKSRGENLEDRQIKRYIRYVIQTIYRHSIPFSLMCIIFRSQRRKARKENQSQARTQKSTDPFTDASESKKTEIKSEKNIRDVQSRLEPPQEKQEKKKITSKQNELSKKEQDTSRTTEWVEEMNKINDQKSKEKKKVKQNEKKKQSSSASNETLASSSTEFSPIVYWREPIPDVEILGLEPSCNSEVVSLTKSSDDELKRCLSLDNKSVWLEKSKCDDAEAKFHVKKSHEAKKSSTEEKDEDKSKSKPKKTAGQQGKAPENTTNKDYEINDYGDKTLEDVLEDFRCDNERFRTKIIGLSQIIDNLQIRIGHLESKPVVEVKNK